MNVAVIPARGGSKRIPGKNVRDFCGQPMIAWPIRALRASGCVERIVVSTDDVRIAEVARDLGAEVPFMRPAALSDDHTPTLPVISHAIEQLRLQGQDVAHVCCVYPTAPLLDAACVREGLARLRSQPALDYVFSAATFPFPPQRALQRSGEWGVEPMFPQWIDSRSQDLRESFHDAGQFYWGTARAFVEQRPIFGPRSSPLLIPRHKVQDIDTPEDWARAELLFQTFQERSE